VVNLFPVHGGVECGHHFQVHRGIRERFLWTRMVSETSGLVRMGGINDEERLTQNVQEKAVETAWSSS
jgi:hypothetical protein